MLTENIHKALKELCDEVKKIVADRIERYGVNPRTGTNTLQGSRLEKSINVEPTENGIAFQIADYYEFVSRGWQRTHNYPNTMHAFISNVMEWVKRKNIRVDGIPQASLVFLIIRNIINNGIKARPFIVYDKDGDLTKMIPELDAYLEEWFDDLFNAIIIDITKYFNK